MTRTFDDFLTQASAHWSEAFEADIPHKRVYVLLAADAIELRRIEVCVHESHLNPVFVEHGRHIGNPGKDQPQIVNPLPILFKLHRSAIVDVDDNVVERKLAQIISDLGADTPVGTQLADLL